MIMGQTSDLVKVLYDFLEEFIYWKNPEKSVELMKEALKLPIPLLIGFFWLPLRYLAVFGLWAVAAQHSPFFSSVISISVLKSQEAYVYFDAKFLQNWFSDLKAHLKSHKIPLYSMRFYFFVVDFCKKRCQRYKRLRPRGYEK